MKKLLLLTILLCSSLLCQAQKERIILGDEQTSEYFPILKGKRIAIFSNHTGMVGDKHLLDILLENEFNVKKQGFPSFPFMTEKTKSRVKHP